MLSLLIILILAIAGVAMFADVVISQPVACERLMSEVWRIGVVDWLGGQTLAEGQVALPLARLLGLSAVAVLLAWLAGGALLRCCGRMSWREAFTRWGRWGGAWGIVCGAWWAKWLVFTLTGWVTAAGLMELYCDLFVAVIVAGACATWTAIAIQARTARRGPNEVTSPPTPSASRLPAIGVLAAMLVYTAVYFTLNAKLYQNLLIPHGDTAMYEEHLWNLEHGKGFRSYLDPGLFLGEHIQVVHILLVPLHLIWPSHLLLELCQSAALAAGAWPVFLIARRHTGSVRAALLLAIAYLCYTPMQYLDIAIDLKTFRPTAFGIPTLLLAIDAMERGRYRSMSLWMLLALSCQEDFAIPIGCLSAWLLATSAITHWKARRSSRDLGSTEAPHRKGVIVGGAVLALSIVYLLVAIKLAIPWFRGEDVPHYTRYFSKFGDTPMQIVWGMLTKPHLLLAELFTANTLTLTLHLLVPLGLLSLFSPGRLLVGAPLWVLLGLNTLARDPPLPVHHFHAPLVPILIWSAIAGVGNATRFWKRRTATPSSDPSQAAVASSSTGSTFVFASFVLGCSIFTGLFNAVGPQSLKFWDSGRSFYWRDLYVINERAQLFDKVAAQIPQTARVASTDFVHPRFTHHERSYDYSLYERRVAGDTTHVPPDTEYIVIDTGHRYSWIHSPEEVRELKEEPEKWELLPDETAGYFIVLRRRP